MVRTLRIDHDLGEYVGKTTCGNGKGAFCKYLGARKLGTIPGCMVFDQDLAEHTKGKHKGWLARLPQCLAAEVKQ